VQARVLRQLWSQEEERLDQDELEAFEAVERLEQLELAEQVGKERAATNAEKNYYGDHVMHR